MFCLFCTIPAEDKSEKNNSRKTKKKSVMRSLVTWSLVFIWVFLIAFGLVSATSPSWLDGFAKHGREGESRQIKDRGDFLLRDRNYPLALAQYRRALEINPDFTGAIVNSAIAFNKSGEPEKGIKLLREAIKNDPNHPGMIYFNIGEIYHDMKQYEKATEYYYKALGADCDPILTLKKLLMLYMQTKQHDKSQETARKLLEYQNDPLTPYKSMLYKYSTIYENKSEHYEFFENLRENGITADQLAEYDLEVIRDLSSSDPEVAKTHNNLAFIYALSGDIDKAIEHFEESERIWPGNRDAVKNLKYLRHAKNNERLATTSK